MITPTLKLNDNMPIWQMSVERYHAIIAAGIFTPDDKLELIDGFLIERPKPIPPRSYSTGKLHRLLFRMVEPVFYLLTRNPITLGMSEPEPDIAIARNERRDYIDRHPNAAETLLVIEVSEENIHQDRIYRKQIYARSGIRMYWIVNLWSRRVEVYTRLDGETYRQVDYFSEGAIPVILDGKRVGEIKVEEILP